MSRHGGGNASPIISFALRHETWTALGDGGAARCCGKALDVPVLGTLGGLVVAKREDDLEEVRPAFEALWDARLPVDDAGGDQVLRMVGEV